MAAPLYTPQAISQAGGDLVTITWDWPGAGPFVATLAQDGQAYPLTDGALGGPLGPFTPMGQPLRIWTPPLPSRDAAVLSLAPSSAPGSPVASLTLLVVADNYWGQMFSLRAMLPTTWDAGARSIAGVSPP